MLYPWRFDPYSSANMVQDSPNPRGIMGSKASGEPSLLLTTSILYAIRHALMAAHKEIFPSETPTTAAAPGSPRGPLDLAQGTQAGADNVQIGAKGKELSASGSNDDYFVFSAPATTARLKTVSLLKKHDCIFVLDDTGGLGHTIELLEQNDVVSCQSLVNGSDSRLWNI